MDSTSSLGDYVAPPIPTKCQQSIVEPFSQLANQAETTSELESAKCYQASVFYMKPDPLYDKQKPYFMNVPIDPAWGPKIKQTNVSYTRKTIAVADVRGHERLFSLDKHGFCLQDIHTSLEYHDFTNTDLVVTRYYQEVQVFLKQYTGATEILPFDFQVRRKDPTLPVGSRGAPGKAQPFGVVHADFAEKYAKKRFQIINVWKPLRGPVYSSPLAVCDYRTVKTEDMVPTDIVFPDFVGETLNFWPNPNHRFYYVDGQREDEAWMIKCFDSGSTTDPNIAQCMCCLLEHCLVHS
ncbi:Putative Aspirochlorine biosynthesis protein N [Podospora comata]|uniref:Aspirochlorine biosynthesis protein N n=1 Tax=Podospora comata TaxID=48703 RepID=A0ABY6SIG2_PODCO|nr:Putative Aspirochlorine biosynthesis protein N [Podospora comata]